MTKILHRRGSAAQWTAANTILDASEIGYESDTGKLKIGDGSTAWSSLPYSVTSTELASEVASLVDAAPSTLDTLNELAAALGDDPNFATTVTATLGTKVTGDGITDIVALTQAQYDALTPDATTLYVITD